LSKYTPTDCFFGDFAHREDIFKILEETKGLLVY